MYNFIQSSPPLTVAGGGYLVYDFGIINQMKVFGVSGSIPLNIPAGVRLTGPAKLSASILSGPVVQNFELVYLMSGLSNVTSGDVVFSAAFPAGILLPGGTLQVIVYPDRFFVPPPFNYPLIVSYEAI